MAAAPKPVDPRAARFNEGVTAFLLLLAFVVNRPLLIPAVATLLLAGGVLGPRSGPFLALHAELVVPRLGPPPEGEDPRALRFAALLGAAILAASTVAFVAGQVNVGWSLALIMVVMTGLSASTEFCLGCEIYSAIKGRPAADEGLREEKLKRPQPSAVRTEYGRPGHPHSVRWMARWVGVRTLGQWVKIVGQTADGGWIVRAGSDRFVLPHGEKRFWPLVLCPACQSEITSLDIVRHQRAAVCDDCAIRSTRSSDNSP